MAIASGDWWELDDFGVLNIYCTGDMPDYETTLPPWYENADQILSVTIDTSVTSIGTRAFRGCTVMTSVTIPDSVTSIGGYAFYSCSSLTSVTIPDSVTSIGEWAFPTCTGLTSVTIGDSVTSIGNGAFSGCTALTDVTIPDSVTSIGDWAFYNCTALTNVTIGDSVTTIGHDAFAGCRYLTSLAIPSGVTAIANSLCASCLSLASLTIPETVTSIGDDAFSGVRLLSDIYFGGSKRQWRTITVGINNEALYNATLHYVSVPDPETALEYIEVTTPPTKTTYSVGEVFNRSGMVVTAHFHDGLVVDVPDYTTSPTTQLSDVDTTITVSYEEDGVTATTTVTITVTTNYNPDPSSWETTYPRTASNVMSEISGRIGVPLDARTIGVIGFDDIEATALSMSMREVAGYIAAHYGGNWTVTDIGTLYLAPLAIPTQASGVISADNVENLDDYDPLEPWSGVRGIWDGDEFDAADPDMEEQSRIVKRGDVVGSAGDESGRVLIVKIAFGQVTGDASRIWNNGARVILGKIQDERYLPFTARNAVIDPACEMGDAVELPDGESVIVSMSGELDGLCAVDVSAPPDEAINTAYPASWL